MRLYNSQFRLKYKHRVPHDPLFKKHSPYACRPDIPYSPRTRRIFRFSSSSAYHRQSIFSRPVSSRAFRSAVIPLPTVQTPAGSSCNRPVLCGRLPSGCRNAPQDPQSSVFPFRERHFCKHKRIHIIICQCTVKIFFTVSVQKFHVEAMYIMSRTLTAEISITLSYIHDMPVVSRSYKT